MTVVNKTFSQMLDDVGEGCWRRYDILSSTLTPELFHETIELLPKHIAAQHDFERLPPEMRPAKYAVRGNWQAKFDVVRYVALQTGYCVELAAEAGLVRDWRPEVPFWEAYSNAFMWGNNFDPSRPVSIKLYKGERGSVVRIRDDGAGFDVAEVLRKMELREPYATKTGMGMRNFRRDETVEVSWEDGGRAANIRVL